MCMEGGVCVCVFVSVYGSVSMCIGMHVYVLCVLVLWRCACVYCNAHVYVHMLVPEGCC